MEKYITSKLNSYFLDKGININGDNILPTYFDVLNYFEDKFKVQIFLDYFYYDGFHYYTKWVTYSGEYGEHTEDELTPDGFTTREEAYESTFLFIHNKFDK